MRIRVFFKTKQQNIGTTYDDNNNYWSFTRRLRPFGNRFTVNLHGGALSTLSKTGIIVRDKIPISKKIKVKG